MNDGPIIFGETGPSKCWRRALKILSNHSARRPTTEQLEITWTARPDTRAMFVCLVPCRL
eukprot:2271131-Prymnesium_polylepis.1